MNYTEVIYTVRRATSNIVVRKTSPLSVAMLRLTTPLFRTEEDAIAFANWFNNEQQKRGEVLELPVEHPSFLSLAI